MEGEDTSEHKELKAEGFEDFEFKNQYSEERRKSEFIKIKDKYPKRIPVIVEKLNDKKSQDLPSIDQNKFLIPDDFDFQQLQGIIRKRLQLKPTQVMYLVLKSNKIYGGDKKISLIYEHEKDEDGFLYLKYSGQEYTGQVI